MPPTKAPSKLFDCLNAINYKNPEYKYDKKDCSGYLLLLWFSHSSDCIEVVNRINRYLFDLPDDVVFKYLYKSIPKGNRFLKWDKVDKEKSLLKRQQELIQSMMDEFGYSKMEATKIFKQYLCEDI